MTDDQVIQILTSFDNVLKLSNIFSYVFRSLGWWLIKFLEFLGNELEKIGSQAYNVIDFFDVKDIDKLINTFKPIIWAIFLLSIIFVSYRIVLDRNFKGSNVIMNVIIALLVFTLLPSFMIEASNITKDAVSAVKSDYKSTADVVIKSYLTDNLYLDDNDFSSKKLTNNIPSDRVSKVDITEEIDSSDAKNQKVFENEVIYDKDGNTKLQTPRKFFGLIKKQYYRYHFDYFNGIIALICVVLVQIFVPLKVARLIFDLAFNKIFAMMYVFGDIALGQRLKNIVQHIASIFVIIFATVLLQRLFTIYNLWLGTLEIAAILKTIFLVAGTWAVIDAPDIIERTFGIDAGIKSSFSTALATYGGISSVARNLNRSMENLTKSISNLGKGGNSRTQDLSKSVLGGNSRKQSDGVNAKDLSSRIKTGNGKTGNANTTNSANKNNNNSANKNNNNSNINNKPKNNFAKNNKVGLNKDINSGIKSMSTAHKNNFTDDLLQKQDKQSGDNKPMNDLLQKQDKQSSDNKPMNDLLQKQDKQSGESKSTNDLLQKQDKQNDNLSTENKNIGLPNDLKNKDKNSGIESMSTAHKNNFTDDLLQKQDKQNDNLSTKNKNSELLGDLKDKNLKDRDLNNMSLNNQAFRNNDVEKNLKNKNDNTTFKDNNIKDDTSNNNAIKSNENSLNSNLNKNDLSSKHKFKNNNIKNNNKKRGK